MFVPGVVAFLVCVFALSTFARPRSGNRKLPPGPRGFPFLGNVLQIPGQHLATHFRTLIHKYGPLVSLNIVGIRIILIGNIDLAKEILEKRSSKFSSRPAVPYIEKYINPNRSLFGMIPNTDEQWRIGRKITTGIMSAVRGGATEPLLEFEALVTVHNILNEGGKEWSKHICRGAASSALAASFGVHFPTGDEVELEDAEYCTSQLLELSAPSASVINVFPFLDAIPGPMPWRTRAKVFRERFNTSYGRLGRYAVTGKAAGMNTWAKAFLNSTEGNQIHLLSQVTDGAIETTSISLRVFVLACLLYPEWISAAQKHIDDVVGTGRLPRYSDRPQLPYVDAIVREIFRWRPPGRFGVPHQSTADDIVEYNGVQYFIPKGSIVFAVAWAIEHDPSQYKDHDRFDPERFLDSRGQLRPGYATSVFGFGRRSCPGLPFAERAVWITVAMLLWTFDIRKSDDPKTGRPFVYDASDAAFSGNFSNPPRPFPAAFEPRTSERSEVVRREWELCEKDLNMILPDSNNY